MRILRDELAGLARRLGNDRHVQHDVESSLVNWLNLSVFMISVIGPRLPGSPGVFTQLSLGS
ncbi:MAG: hypothetical protein ACYC9Z_11490 [Casimicrobiaceae bacterium]